MSDTYAKMSHEARELFLFIENDAQLHRSQEVPIQKNLINKMAAGTYDKTLAVKLWGYLVESGAKKYTQEHCGRDCVWSRQFPPGVRKEVAELFAKGFEVEAKLGNYDHLLMKKHQKASAGSAKRKGGGGADYAMAKPYYATGGGGARAKKIKSLTVIERVWRDKTYGNNYASVEILINGKHAAKLPAAYGSGSLSEDRVVEWLDKHGYVKAPPLSHGGRSPLHRVASDNGFTKNVESFHVLKREM